MATKSLIVSVDSLGKVLNSYAPSLPLKLASHNGAASLTCEKECQHLKTTSNDGSTRLAAVDNFGSEVPKTGNSEQDMLKRDSRR